MKKYLILFLFMALWINAKAVDNLALPDSTNGLDLATETTLSSGYYFILLEPTVSKKITWLTMLNAVKTSIAGEQLDVTGIHSDAGYNLFGASTTLLPAVNDVYVIGELLTASDTANAYYGAFYATGNEVKIVSGKSGTSTYKPITIYNGGRLAGTIDTLANVLFLNTLNIGDTTKVYPELKLNVRIDTAAFVNIADFNNADTSYGGAIVLGQKFHYDVNMAWWGSHQPAYNGLLPNTGYINTGTGASQLALSASGAVPIVFFTDDWDERGRFSPTNGRFIVRGDIIDSSGIYIGMVPSDRIFAESRFGVRINNSDSITVATFLNQDNNNGASIVVGQDSTQKNVALAWWGSGGATYNSLIPRTAYLNAGTAASQLALNSSGTAPIIFATDNWNERARFEGTTGDFIVKTAIYVTPDSLTSHSLDASLGNSFIFHLTKNDTLFVTNLVDGMLLGVDVSNDSTWTLKIFVDGAQSSIIWKNGTEPTQSTGTYAIRKYDKYIFERISSKTKVTRIAAYY